MLSMSKAALSRAVTTMRMKEAMSQLGCLVCDQHYLDMTKPNVYDSYVVKSESAKQASSFPAVWRDQVSANIRLAATPEGRSLTSL